MKKTYNHPEAMIVEVNSIDVMSTSNEIKDSLADKDNIIDDNFA